jgi:hypothetical protein
MRKIYLSGPMRGYPESNYPLFHRVAAELRGAGHVVYNPAEFAYGPGKFPIRKAFAEYAKFICEEACTIVLLPGWPASKGATTERGLADNCGLSILQYGIDVVD